MSTFGDDLIQSLNEALAHAKGEGPAIVHAPLPSRAVQKQAQLNTSSSRSGRTGREAMLQFRHVLI